MASTSTNVIHTCPGCKANYAIPADPDLQPISCGLCRYPIREVRDSIATIFAIEYAERHIDGGTEIRGDRG